VTQPISRAGNPAADFNRALRCTDDVESFDGLLRAAQGGCLRAQFLVGLAYHTGHGVAVNYEKAAAWYLAAAGSGDSTAIANLGVMTLLGHGMPADDLEAYTWVQSAVGLGHDWLRPALEMLERRMDGRGDAAERSLILDHLSPESPILGPCSQPDCDPSRCKVA
jgi:TPR repeat protein